MRIALIAHDLKKPDFVRWVAGHAAWFAHHDLCATGTTGAQIMAQCPELKIRCYKSGPLGGDQQIGALIAEGQIDLLLFFTDPMTPMPHDVDVKALTRLSTLYNVPFACNEATASLLLLGLNKD